MVTAGAQTGVKERASKIKVFVKTRFSELVSLLKYAFAPAREGRGPLT
jgi:hypothetical protein